MVLLLFFFLDPNVFFFQTKIFWPNNRLIDSLIHYPSHICLTSVAEPGFFFKPNTQSNLEPKLEKHPGKVISSLKASK